MRCYAYMGQQQVEDPNRCMKSSKAVVVMMTVLVQDEWCACGDGECDQSEESESNGICQETKELGRCVCRDIIACLLRMLDAQE